MKIRHIEFVEGEGKGFLVSKKVSDLWIGAGM